MDSIITNVRSNKGPVNLVVEPERCKGCGFCVEFCPKDALELTTDRYNAKGYSFAQLVHAGNCNGCGLCEMYCPDFAIYVTQPAEALVQQASAAQSK